MCSNDQRFFDQKTIGVVVTPQDSSVSPIDVMTRVLFVFGEERENDVGVFVLRSIRGGLLDLVS
jgi:hypothetical protein